jgi:formate dehydrogenase major subunit
MGICPTRGVGYQSFDNVEFNKILKQKWGVKTIPSTTKESFSDRLFKGEFQNLLIFGEDPLGTTNNKELISKVFDKSEFIVVQDAFMTETAKRANVILPSSFWFEAGGSFTNSQRVIQEFDAELNPKVEKNNIEQLIDLLILYGFNELKDIDDVRAEVFSLLPQSETTSTHNFDLTTESIHKPLFNHGCDYFMYEFDKNFEK